MSDNVRTQESMGIREALRRILVSHPIPADAEPFLRLALRIASVHLQNKIAAGTINLAFFGLSLSDLAVDCIGPLFERNVQGQFVQLNHYFAGVHWDDLKDVELLAHARRLVFSKVNQQLARLYSESDPSLQKLIRNLRNAIRSGEYLIEARRGKDLWLVTHQELKDGQSLPLVPWEFMEGELIPRVRANTSLKEIVQHVSSILSEQTSYRRSYPLTTLALIIRTVFVRIAESPDQGVSDDETSLASGEVQIAIADAVKRVSASKRRSYVHSGKVDEITFSAYMEAAKAILEAEFVENDGADRSYQERLRQTATGMSIEEYHARHRCHFEYLVKLARVEFLRSVKREF